MEIFVTGATGYLGSAVCRLLREQGIEVSGLARSPEAAVKLRESGVIPVEADLASADALAAAARKADGVIHAGFQWGAEAGAIDARAVATLIEALAGSGKPFLYTSGTWVMGETKGRVAGEMFPLNPPAVVAWRPGVERTVLDAKERGIRSVVVRPATVYGRGGGRVSAMLREAREQGKVRVVGNGDNHWSFVCIDDVASLYALALERAQAGSLYLAAHGTAVTARAVAEMTARAAGIPGKVDYLPLAVAREQMGAMADCLAMDQQVLSTKAARELGWRPNGPGVLQAIAAGTA